MLFITLKYLPRLLGRAGRCRRRLGWRRSWTGLRRRGAGGRGGRRRVGVRGARARARRACPPPDTKSDENDDDNADDPAAASIGGAHARPVIRIIRGHEIFSLGCTSQHQQPRRGKGSGCGARQRNATPTTGRRVRDCRLARWTAWSARHRPGIRRHKSSRSGRRRCASATCPPRTRRNAVGLRSPYLTRRDPPGPPEAAVWTQLDCRKDRRSVRCLTDTMADSLLPLALAADRHNSVSPPLPPPIARFRDAEDLTCRPTICFSTPCPQR